MTGSEVDGILTFLRSAERLKHVGREAWTSDGARESVAEHSWRLCLMAMVFADRYPGLDIARLMRICLVHDLGEAIGGAIPAPQQEILALWDEYEGADSPEARVAKALDKLETILQHTQGRNPPDFDYLFNLEYGKRYTDASPELADIRARLDAETRRRADESGRVPPQAGGEYMRSRSRTIGAGTRRLARTVHRRVRRVPLPRLGAAPVRVHQWPLRLPGRPWGPTRRTSP